MTKCPTCGGIGKVIDLDKLPKTGIPGNTITVSLNKVGKPCPTCKGTGKMEEVKP